MSTEKTIAGLLIGTLQLDERGMSSRHGKPAFYRDAPDIGKAAGLMCIARRRAVEASVDAGEDFRDLLDAASIRLTLDERRDGVLGREARWLFEDGSVAWEKDGRFATDPPGRAQDTSWTLEADLLAASKDMKTALEALVEVYDKMPDGVLLGPGLKVGHFLDAKAALEKARRPGAKVRA